MINENNQYIFQTKDNKIIYAPNEIEKMFKHFLPKNTTIILNITSYTLEKVLKYCQFHNYELPQEIKRPLKDNIDDCIDNKLDLEFVKGLSKDDIIYILSESSQLEWKSETFEDLLLTKLALSLRNSSIEKMKNDFHIDENEFSDDIMLSMLIKHSNLFKIKLDRLSELDNDNTSK